MDRRYLLSLLTLPLAACSLQRLPPLASQPLPSPGRLPAWRAPQIGQQWTYRVLNVYNSEQVDTVHETLTALQPHLVIRRRSERHGDLPDEVQSRPGWTLQDPVWDRTQVYDQALPLWPDVLEAGQRATGRAFYRHLGTSDREWIIVHARVSGLERLTLNGQSLDTARVERLIRLSHEDSTRLHYTRTDSLWLAPVLGRWLVRETNGEYWRAGGLRPSPLREDHFRWVLTHWSLS